MSSGIFVALLGVWLIAQVTKGGLLDLILGESPAAPGVKPGQPIPGIPHSGGSGTPGTVIPGAPSNPPTTPLPEPGTLFP